MRELTALGLGEALARQGIENGESCFFNRFGQLIYAEPRGRAAGYPVPRWASTGAGPPDPLERGGERLGADARAGPTTSASGSTRPTPGDPAFPLGGARRRARATGRAPTSSSPVTA